MRKTIAVDAGFLKAFFDRGSRPESVSSLIHQLSAQSAKIIIPTPALAEFLKLNPNSAQNTLDTINKSACFQVRPFDDKASIELAELLGGQVSGIRDLLPFDRQIVAIAKAHGASIIYADDEKVADYAAQCGIPAKRLKDLN
jgi:predicted nucleic acid-binding protein